MVKFGILHLKPCFKIVSDEIEWLRLKFGHMLLAREFYVFLWLHPPFAAIFVNILAFKMLYCNRKQLI